MFLRKSLVVLAALALVGTGRDVNAGIITGLYGTGFSSTGVALTANQSDGNYVVTSSPNGAFTPTVVANIPSSYATVPTSQWISQPGFPDVVNGTYVYQTSFNDTDAAGTLTGKMSADDKVTVFLNGVQVFATPDTGFGAFYGFSITGLKAGLNVLTFSVDNTHYGPEALNVTISAVPEPASLAMVALGLGGVFAARRFRRRAV